MTFRHQLLSQQPLVGTLLTLPSPDVAEILASTGFDWLFLDLEHSPMNARDAQALLQAAGNVPCLVRVETRDETGIRKALDIGAQGIIVPQVNSAEDAARIVSLARYSPQGTRGVGLARAHGYGLKFQEYVQRANDETAVVIQIEHATGVANVDAILAVPGIDTVLIGPYDLSGSLGKLGAVNDPEVQAAIDKVLDSCRRHNITAGIFAATAAEAQKHLDRGFSLLAVATDALLLGRAAVEALEALKSRAT
ncbi:MAG TPA: aldolase/citrate lyase family protein [Anaerolineae bacterium]